MASNNPPPNAKTSCAPPSPANWCRKNLRRMVQFAELFPGQDIVVTLSRQLSWSHFLALLPVKDPLARDFYAQMCSIERWSVRTLRERVAADVHNVDCKTDLGSLFFKSDFLKKA